MKQRAQIAILLVAVVLAACNRPVETRFIASPDPNVSPAAIASPELSAIDSLMWQRPDSALACLLPWFDTCGDAKFCVSTAYDRHYAHLLLAELLYKNDYAQTNRTELRQAVAYFDSLTFALNDAPNPCAPLFFLAARAHYINGVGYYERDSLVEACTEYLKTLETMEEHFEEKALVGKKAKFLIYTYNRLGDMFSELFMMDAAIYCYKNSCKISRTSPISTLSVSSALYRIGNQFDKKKEADSASCYYLAALSNIPDTFNLLYRDIVSSQSLLSYQQTHQGGPTLQRLKQMVAATDDFDEKVTRYLTIGAVCFENRQYDSARHYLQLVFENQDAIVAQLQAAEFLRILCDSLGEKEESDNYMRFLAMHKPMEHDSEAKVSVLGELFKNHLEKRQKQQSEKDKLEERQHAIKRTLAVLVPIFLCVLFVFVLFVGNKHKKNLMAKENEAERKMHEQTRQHEERVRRIQTDAEKALEETEKRHTEAIEAERQAHHIEQSAMSGRLKRSNQELRDLREQIKNQNPTTTPTEQVASFADEPICRLIMERVKEGRFLSQMDCTVYRDHALDKNHLSALRSAVNRHFNQFTTRIGMDYPDLTRIDIDYCCLYLLGLTDADVAALMQRAYNTVNERSNKLKRIFGSENPIFATVQTIANGYILH